MAVKKQVGRLLGVEIAETVSKTLGGVVFSTARHGTSIVIRKTYGTGAAVSVSVDAVGDVIVQLASGADTITGTALKTAIAANTEAAAIFPSPTGSGTSAIQTGTYPMDTPGNYRKFATLTSKTFTINEERIDWTTYDPSGSEAFVRETAAGMKSWDLSADGRHSDEQVLRQVAEAKASKNSVVWARFDDLAYYTYSGLFAIPSLSLDGGLPDAATFSITCESTGNIAQVAR